MVQTRNYLAFDLGAESGRAVVGQFDGERLTLTPVHRFSNGPVQVGRHLYWDVLRLFGELKQGLALFRKQYGPQLDGIGLDTWGVDFAVLGRNDTLLGNPHHYRDPRTEGMLKVAFDRVPRQVIFDRTGIQFMQINTLFQLLAMKLSGDPTLDQAQTLLMMPDLLNFWLTGTKVCEFSIATTSQAYDPRRRDWAREMIERLGLPAGIFQAVVQPGTVLGPLRPEVASEVGLEGDELVIAPACHDTGSAVAAVPAQGDDFAYISSGTWSLMGVEIPEPVITRDSLAYNFTNEGGVCGTYRFLKNIMGLWLVQECRRTWAMQGQELSYGELTDMASESPAFGPLVEPDAHDFLAPGDMPERIASFCARTGQREPQGKGEFVRCALESLACKYRWVLEKLELMLGRTLSTIHIVGGGCQNRLLCQLAADATGRAVIAGPVEATAAGNILMQALARGRISSLADGRDVVRRSLGMTAYEPRPSRAWHEAYGRFVELHDRMTEL